MTVILEQESFRDQVVLWHPGILAQAPDDDFFDPAVWRDQGKLLSEAEGRGAAYFLQANADESWVLRHYRRGGWVARFNDDKYLWTGASRSRPVREARLLAALYGRGLAVPCPVAARAVRYRGFWYTADLVTVAIKESVPLADHLQQQPLPTPGWEALGASIAELHRTGVWHADLNARNVLVTARNRFYLIDFDRARFRGDGAWRQANLDRFKRSLEKFLARSSVFYFTDEDWAALNSGYCAIGV